MAQLLGIPGLMLNDNDAEQLALAWVRLQQEYPSTKIPRRYSVMIDMGLVASKVYMPIVAQVVLQARAAKNRPKTPFVVPVRNPADVRPVASGDGPPNGAPHRPETVSAGGEMIFTTGAPDYGKINFEE